MAKRVSNDLLLYRLNEQSKALSRLETKVDNIHDSVVILKVKMAGIAFFSGLFAALGLEYFQG